MRSTAVTNPMLFEAKAALRVLTTMKHFSNKEFDLAFESPLEIIQELRMGKYGQKHFVATTKLFPFD